MDHPTTTRFTEITAVVPHNLKDEIVDQISGTLGASVELDIDWQFATVADEGMFVRLSIRSADPFPELRWTSIRERLDELLRSGAVREARLYQNHWAIKDKVLLWSDERRSARAPLKQAV